MSELYWYRAHGLLIQSNLALSEFVPAAEGETDICVRIGQSGGQVHYCSIIRTNWIKQTI